MITEGKRLRVQFIQSAFLKYPIRKVNRNWASTNPDLYDFDLTYNIILIQTNHRNSYSAHNPKTSSQKLGKDIMVAPDD